MNGQQEEDSQRQKKLRVRDRKKGSTGFDYGFLRIPVSFPASQLQWSRGN